MYSKSYVRYDCVSLKTKQPSFWGLCPPDPLLQRSGTGFSPRKSPGLDTLPNPCINYYLLTVSTSVINSSTHSRDTIWSYTQAIFVINASPRQNLRRVLTINVTVSAKTVLIGTFSITRKTNLKYSSCCGSVVLDLSYAKFTV